MRFFVVLFALLASLSAWSLDYLPRYFVVDQVDVPEEGWYWDPEHSGWGLNMTIQPASFTESGYYVQGAIYTYDENGNAFFYTFQNPYVPNPDVFAWREGRGLMGSFNSLLAENEGGNCLVCDHQPRDIFASDLGEVTIEWESPIKAVMRVGNRVIDIEHFYFQDGLRNPTADFLTEGLWSVNGLSTGYSFTPANPPFRPDSKTGWAIGGIKGNVNFNEVNFSDISNYEFVGLSTAHSSFSSLKWYRTEINTVGIKNIYSFDSSENTPPLTVNDMLFTNDYQDLGGIYNASYIVGYNPDTLMLFIFAFDHFSDRILVCNDGNMPTYFVAEYKPAVASEIRAYHPFDQPDYFDCGTPAHDMPLELKRQRVLNLTRIMPGNDDLSKIGFFSKH